MRRKNKPISVNENAGGIPHNAEHPLKPRFFIEYDWKAQPQPVHERLYLRNGFGVIHCQDDDALILIPLRCSLKHRHFGATWRTPRRPEIEHDDLSTIVAQTHRCAIQQRSSEIQSILRAGWRCR